LNVIGNGQIAKAFKQELMRNVTIFASGVSDSTCTNIASFQREEKLLKESLKKSRESKFVYFSSCALSAKEGYVRTPYYDHKYKMEKIISDFTNNAYIFRIPQLFGAFVSHKTIINYFCESIINEKNFKVYDDAYRYLIHLEDVKILVLAYLNFSQPVCVDLANPYRYKVIDIVRDLESVLGKIASYHLVHKTDKYTLDLAEMIGFMNLHNIEIGFGEDYFRKRAEFIVE